MIVRIILPFQSLFARSARKADDQDASDRTKVFYRKSLCRAMVEFRDATDAFNEARKRHERASIQLNAWTQICAANKVSTDTPYRGEEF